MAFNNSSSNNQQLKQGDDEENTQKKNLIILVDKDSDDKLDELFEKTLSNKTTLHKPYKMRNLPASFFKPPPSGSKSPSVSHSRENSADSAFGSGTTILGSNSSNQNPIASNQSVPIVARELIHHSRAHSSPASLGKLPLNINLNLSALTLGTAIQTNSPNPSGITNISNKLSQQQSTKVNNTSIGTLNSNAASLITSNNISLDKSLQHNHSRGRSYDISSLQQQLHFGDLPSGWEQAKTHDGKIYYINHNTRTTQWQDPRTDFISATLSQNNLFSSSSENSSVETIFSTPVLGPSQNPTEPQSQAAVITPSSSVGQLVINSSNLTPLEWPWEEAVTENGERYYINHLNRSTSWRDPRLSNQEWEQNLRIYNLQLERERLKTRRQEIAKLNIGEDPFLSGIADHTRQESGDSGLSVSISQTPDFLSTIDDSMDGEYNEKNSSLDVMESFNEAMETPDDFMLNDPLLLEKIDGLM